MVSVGINGNDKGGAGPWEALLRERVRVELSLRELLKVNQEKVERYELVIEERDAWKASTRQLEDSVFDLSQRNRKLEEAVFQLEDNHSPGSSPPTLERDPYDPESSERLPQGSFSRSPTPSPSPTGNKAMTLSEIKHMIQQQHGKDEKPPPSRKKKQLSGYIDFSKTGCPKCNKDLVLIV